MTVLEDAVADLAGALQHLESKLEGRLYDLSAEGEDVDAARRQARAAHAHVADAARGLSASITELRTLLADDDANASGRAVEQPQSN
ncbi:MAG: hypothetical protein AAGA09_03060 [Pseudomonadota bacterium]